MKHKWLIVALVACGAASAASAATAQDPPSPFKVVENWVHFPPEVAKWGMATGVDVDAQDNVYVLHRIPAMPIMMFDRHGTFLRAWGQGLFTTTHFLRVDR